MLYFAYGSNMSSKRLEDRVCIIGCKGVFTLEEYVLEFNKVSKKDGSGKCNIHYTGCKGDRVIGVLFELDNKCEKRLDRCEGCGSGGYEKKVIGIDFEDKKVIIKDDEYKSGGCFTYMVDDTTSYIKKGLKPYTWYKKHVLKGAREHGFEESYIAEIEKVEADEDPCREREEKESSICCK